MKYIDLFIKQSLAEITGKGSKPRKTKASKRKRKAKEWSWDKYSFTPKERKDVVKASVLKQVDAKQKYRTFDGKIPEHKVVDAYGMDSYVGGADIGSAPDTGNADAGYGFGTYGVTPYGEALNRASARIRAGLKNLKGELSDTVIKAMLDGYASMFTRLVNDSALVMHAIQPSMAKHIGFDLDTFIDAFNNYEGQVYSITLNGASNLEPTKVVAEWLVHNGANQEKVNKIVFIEKHSPCKFGEDATSIPAPSKKSAEENSMSKFADIAELIDSLHDPVFVGCIDPYMIGESMLAANIADKKYQVDERYIYSI